MSPKILYILNDNDKIRGIRGDTNFDVGENVKFLRERYRRHKGDGDYVLLSKHRNKTFFVDFKEERIDHVVEIIFNNFLRLP